jgi:hypothetical protein
VETEVGTSLGQVLKEVIEPIRVEAEGTAYDATHLVAFSKEKISQVGAVLTSATGDQSSWHKEILPRRCLSMAYTTAT